MPGPQGPRCSRTTQNFSFEATYVDAPVSYTYQRCSHGCEAAMRGEGTWVNVDTNIFTLLDSEVGP